MNILDFEVCRGTRALPLRLLRDIIQYFPYKHPYRIYLMLLGLSLRPAEPTELTWHNFTNGLIVFRPSKQKGRVLRKIKAPPGVWAEIMAYKASNFFPEPGKLFNFSSESFRRSFNALRPKLGPEWLLLSEELRSGRVARFHIYGLHNFRTGAATLAYYYYSLVYGHGDLALTCTCQYMGHSCNKMTAQYYIKRIEEIGLQSFPRMPYLELLDFVIYGETQKRITEYSSDRQALAVEY